MGRSSRMVFLLIFTSIRRSWHSAGYSDEIAADLMLSTVNDVCVSLFVGDCFSIAGISITLADLCHYLLLWISISSGPSFTDLVSEFLESGVYSTT